MKYRRLQPKELTELQDEFIRFLASNQVTAPDWEKLKKENASKAENLIDLFSDLVFDQTLEKIEYLEFKAPKDIKTFHCGPEKIRMLGLIAEGRHSLDFTQNEAPELMLNRLGDSGASLKVYRAEKGYHGSRKEELFRMLEEGCLISKDGALFKTLEKLVRQ